MEHENEAGGSSQMKKRKVEGVQTEENKEERRSCEEIRTKLIHGCIMKLHKERSVV